MAAHSQPGTAPRTGKAAAPPLHASVTSALGAGGAVRAAYEQTLRERLGAFLDDTNRLRYELQNGEAVIDEIRALRGATCTPASFTPPAKQDARITGRAATLKISGLSCQVGRTQEATVSGFPLSCTLPSVELTRRAPRYTGRTVSPAQATTEECIVKRRYGLEASVSLTLRDPASFFSDEDANAPGAPPNYNFTVTVSQGPADSAASGGGGSTGDQGAVRGTATDAAGGGGAGGSGSSKSPTTRVRSQSGGGGGGRASSSLGSYLRGGGHGALHGGGGAAGGQGGYSSLGSELRQRLAAELQRRTVQVVLEWDRPNVASNLEDAFRALRDIAERNAARRRRSPTAVEYADSILGRLLGPDARFSVNLAKEISKRLNVTEVFDSVFVRALGGVIARRAHGASAGSGVGTHSATPSAANAPPTAGASGHADSSTGTRGAGQAKQLPLLSLLAKARASAAAAKQQQAKAGARGARALPTLAELLAGPQAAAAAAAHGGLIESELAALSSKLHDALDRLRAAAARPRAAAAGGG